MYMQSTQQTFSLRFIGISVITALHIVAIIALNSGLTSSIVEIIKGPIETRVIEEIKPDEKEPPPPPPKLEEIKQLDIPPPDIMIEAPTEAAPTAISAEQAPVQSIKIRQTAPRSDSRYPITRPPYPPTSRRLGEEGTVTLSLLVLANGRVAEAKVQKSSGSARLDEAARKEALRYRFIPGTHGDTPVDSWHSLKMTFRLDQQ